MGETNINDARRGQVWYVKFNDAVGYEEAVGRPAVIVSTDEGITVAKTLTAVYMTTTPKSGGLSVKLFTPKKECWAMCNQIVTIDKSRFMSMMCNLTETEMLRVDGALRKALALPMKTADIEDKLTEAEEKVTAFEVERDTYKKLYEKALEELVAIKLNKDFVAKAATIEVPKPVVVEPEKLDLSELKKSCKRSGRETGG